MLYLNEEECDLSRVVSRNDNACTLTSTFVLHMDIMSSRVCLQRDNFNKD
jgi:hypothetical protein